MEKEQTPAVETKGSTPAPAAVTDEILKTLFDSQELLKKKIMDMETREEQRDKGLNETFAAINENFTALQTDIQGIIKILKTPRLQQSISSGEQPQENENLATSVVKGIIKAVTGATQAAPQTASSGIMADFAALDQEINTIGKQIVLLNYRKTLKELKQSVGLLPTLPETTPAEHVVKT